MIKCSKCNGRVFVDRVFTTPAHLELYCLLCGKREMYPHPESKGKRARWIMAKEKARARATGTTL